MVNYQSLKAQVEIATQEPESASMYAAGKFDAIIGAQADREWIANPSYRRGYSDSYWEFYREKYGIRVVPETTESAKARYSDGYFDGIIGDRPQQKLLVNSATYRSGYQEGLMAFYLEEAQSKLTTKS